MHDRRREIEGRLTRALDERLHPAVHTTVAPLTVEVWHVPAADDGRVGEPVPFAVARESAYLPCDIGERWGPAWGTSWFRITGSVPDDLTDAEAVVDLGFTRAHPGFQAEGLVHDPGGRIVKGLNPRNDWIPARAGAVEWYVEAAANPTLLNGFRPTDEGDRLTSSTAPLYRLRRADLCRRETDVAELVADLEVLDGLRRSLPDDQRAAEILYAIEAALDALDLADVVGTAAAARAELAGALGTPAAPAAPAAPGGHTISAVGHAHIDSAWLCARRSARWPAPSPTSSS